VTDILTWIRSVPYFKSGSLLTYALILNAIITALQTVPDGSDWHAYALAAIAVFVKLTNPADHKTTLTGKE
jgi:hypothetical protein